MRMCHLFAALGGWAALGVASAVAQVPNLLPESAQHSAIRDEADDADSQETSHRESGDAAASSAPDAPPAFVPFGGYPYSRAWHAGYQHPMYGRPVALVVPPVSHYQTIYGWGIATTQMTPIYPQYGGPGYGTPAPDVGGHYLLPPYWPSDTRQFGVYYIRGPW